VAKKDVQSTSVLFTTKVAKIASDIRPWTSLYFPSLHQNNKFKLHVYLFILHFFQIRNANNTDKPKINSHKNIYLDSLQICNTSSPN